MNRVEYWLTQINKMIDSGNFERSEDFLFDVGEWIETNDRITDKQIETIKNIKNG